MKIERVDIKTLLPDPSNVRKHSPKNLDAIKGSLKKFGQQKPIVVDHNNIVIAGNGTLEAAQALGWDRLDIVRTDLKGSDAVAFALADNRTTDLSEFDDEELDKVLSALAAEDYDIASIGFDDFDVFEPKQGNIDDDEVPEVEQNVHAVKRGDIWQLGEHRLMCGDSTSKEDVERLMNGEKADMVFTDPPYGMNLDTDWSSAGGGIKAGEAKSKKYRPVINDEKTFDCSFVIEAFKDAKEIFIWGCDYLSESIPIRTGSIHVWDKHRVGLEKAPGSQFELCWSREKHKRQIARITWSGLYGTEHEHDRKRCHPTQKPVKLAEWFFERWGKPKDIVADLFLGSGSTLIACEKTGRKCYGMEIDEHYCSVIIERWQKFTGKAATRLLDKK